MIFTVAARELRSLFLSPLAWVVLAVTGLIVGVLFVYFINVFVQSQAMTSGNAGSVYGVTDWVISPCLSVLGFIGLFVMPLITMRLVSEERHNGTLTLLLSSPVPVPQIVLGKFLAVCVFALLMTLLPVIMGLSLVGGTHLDYGQFAVASGGTLLMLMAFAAVGELVSTVAASPVLAAMITYGVLLLLWITQVVAQSGGGALAILKWTSILQHQETFQRGLVDSTDTAYYLLVIALFLLLSIRRLDAERLQA